jgi:NitT/TauT family transport system substrate-binding protein
VNPRRARLAGLLVAVALVGIAAGRLARSAGMAAPMTLRVGTLHIGMIAGETLDWEMRQLERLGLDRTAGLVLEPVRLPGKAATEAALLAGEVDVIVDDWLWVARQRSLGERVTGVYPFSLAMGALVARADGPVKGLADLDGRRLGVVSPTDKSWLVLRAATRRLHGFDPQRRAEVVMAAPATLSKLLAAGELDAIVQYSQHVARLAVDPRFHVVMGVDEMLRAVGAASDVPLLVYVTRDETLRARREAVLAFLRVAREAKARLAGHDGPWEPLGTTVPLARDHGVTTLVQVRWRRSPPVGWSPTAAADAAALFDTLLRVGGVEILGTDRLPPGTLHTEIAP